MYFRLRTLFMACLLSLITANASEDCLVLVPLPLQSIQEGITVQKVPFIIGKALPDTAFHAIGVPYKPPVVSFHEYQDINQASIAGIQVKPEFKTGKDYLIELDYSKVEELHHTGELLGAVLECVYQIAESSGYSVEVKLTNLDSSSLLHPALDRLVKARNKPAAEQPATE